MIRVSLKRIIAFIAILVLAYALYSHNVWWNRVQYLRWLSARTESLRLVGERLLNYAQKHDGRLPQTLEEIIGNGVMARDEVEFTDPEGNIKVTRHLRAVPTSGLAKDLILFVETYDPPPGQDFVVLTLGGCAQVERSRNKEKVIKHDNETRRAHGLPEIPLTQAPRPPNGQG